MSGSVWLSKEEVEKILVEKLSDREVRKKLVHMLTALEYGHTDGLEYK
jgi:hypothetical protein